MKRTNLIWLSLLALILTACQDENFGYTKSEIYQSYIDRKYAEEFAKAFPNVDPNHTWMCTPDTIYHEVEVPGMTRAAGDLPSKPEVEQKGENMVMPYNQVTAALGFMKEGQDNRDNCAQDFEFKALEDSGTPDDGFDEYVITPTFWGRKFCTNNKIGIYYIGTDEQPEPLEPFWDDKNNKIVAYFTDGHRQDVANSDQQITDDPNWANSDHNTSTDSDDYLKLTHPCDDCGLKFSVTGDLTYETYAQWKGIKLVNTKTTGQSWETQFFVESNKTWTPGEQYEFRMKYHSSEKVENVYVQYQSNPGTFVADATNPNNRDGDKTTNIVIDFDNGNGWHDLVFYGTIPQDKYGIKTLAFCLNNQTNNTTYYFRDITWRNYNTPCTKCDGYGRIFVDYYQLPQYTIKVPVGMVWGVYLTTDEQQKSGTNRITWYSNSDWNPFNQDKKTRVKAAATFTHGDVTYVSFEDAPTICDYDGGPWNNRNGTGECPNCHRGHWDHDYNDIVLTITPRPVTKTYRTVSYRVMCEDLGGTFDWDFNDVVYDVIYADGKTQNDKATVTFKLQAIGGTLPIYFEYNGTRLKNNNNKEELHELSTNQTINDKGLYTPVNVGNCEEAKKTNGPITLYTETFNNQKEDINILDYVQNIKIVAQQKNGATTEVVFPRYKGDATPQCFMTQIGTPWADELQPIYEKYPRFKAWVSDCGTVTNWWKVDDPF